MIGSQSYHWQFDPMRLLEHRSFICVQDASGRGPLLRIQWVGLAVPKDVEAAIRFAQANGWSCNGANALEIGVDSNSAPPAFCIKPDGAGRFWFFDKHSYSHRDVPDYLGGNYKSDREGEAKGDASD